MNDRPKPFDQVSQKILHLEKLIGAGEASTQ